MEQDIETKRNQTINVLHASLGTRVFLAFLLTLLPSLFRALQSFCLLVLLISSLSPPADGKGHKCFYLRDKSAPITSRTFFS